MIPEAEALEQKSRSISSSSISSYYALVSFLLCLLLGDPAGNRCLSSQLSMLLRKKGNVAIPSPSPSPTSLLLRSFPLFTLIGTSLLNDKSSPGISHPLDTLKKETDPRGEEFGAGVASVGLFVSFLPFSLFASTRTSLLGYVMASLRATVFPLKFPRRNEKPETEANAQESYSRPRLLARCSFLPFPSLFPFHLTRRGFLWVREKN